ncbi:hypothetical protein GCM10022248_93970 [Nonomuraea soli]
MDSMSSLPRLAAGAWLERRKCGTCAITLGVDSNAPACTGSGASTLQQSQRLMGGYREMQGPQWISAGVSDLSA